MFIKMNLANSCVQVALVVLTLCLPLAATRSFGQSSTRNSAAVNPELPQITAPGFAVVELFTSQGCSSCPAADKVLRSIQTWSEANSQPVFCLSFHVDYWNKLGWTDPYSNPDMTQRQQTYARAMKTDRVYTPFMVINGEHGFVGSKQDVADKLIGQELEKATNVVVKLDAILSESRQMIDVIYDVVGTSANHRLNFAVVEKEVSNEVPRGENSGRTLSHVHVVRVFQWIDLDRQSAGKLSLSLPPDLNTDSLEVIAFTQTKNDMKIDGARRIVIGQSTPNRLDLTESDWRSRLTAAQFDIARQKGTEPQNSFADSPTKKSGVYTCVGCGARLFDATTKFRSGTGWPSFYQPIKGGTVVTAIDNSANMVRTEVLCDRCGAHIGHVFNDGPAPTGQRWCLNGTVLNFVPTDDSDDKNNSLNKQ